MNLLKRLWTSLMAFRRWLVNLPVIQPILELLSYQRTITLLAGLLSFRLAPWLFPDLSPDLQVMVAVITTAVMFALFLGLQKEVLVEAQSAVKSLPTTDDAYVKEFTDLILKAVLDSMAKKPTPVPSDADGVGTTSLGVSRTTPSNLGLSAGAIPPTG